MTPDATGCAEPATGSYFVSAYPPFAAWTPDALADYRSWLDQPRASSTDRAEVPPFGLYVHVPFCIDRCSFCYYRSYDNRPAEIGRTVNALAQEAAQYASTPALQGRNPEFVYIGGGTPSLLSTSLLDDLLSKLGASFDWTGRREFTFECAPKSVTEKKCRLLKSHGVTRISLGVQQLDDDVLRANGRVHLTQDVVRALDTIRSVGFDVVNVDLIAGLVGETDASFDRSLDQVIALEPDSVTIYLLEIPHNTPLFRELRDQETGAPTTHPADWPIKRERLRRGFKRLESAGYSIRSAYTASREGVAENFVYQDELYRGADLLGLGVSAFGYLGGVHHQNLTSIDGYAAALETGKLPLGRAYALSDDEQRVREFVLQLKLGSVDRTAFQARHGLDPAERFRPVLASAARSSWLEITPEAIRLTDEGLLRVDRMLPAFYLPEHRPLLKA